MSSTDSDADENLSPEFFKSFYSAGKEYVPANKVSNDSQKTGLDTVSRSKYCCITGEEFSKLSEEEIQPLITRENFKNFRDNLIIRISKATYEQEEKKGTAHYMIETRIKDRTISKISRRYTEFSVLHEFLKNQFPFVFIQSIPKKHNLKYYLEAKKIIANKKSTIIEKRRTIFEKYLLKALLVREIRSLHDFHLFLSSKESWTQVLRDKILSESPEISLKNPGVPFPQIDDQYFLELGRFISTKMILVDKLCSKQKALLNSYRTICQSADALSSTFVNLSDKSSPLSDQSEANLLAYSNASTLAKDLEESILETSLFPLMALSLSLYFAKELIEKRIFIQRRYERSVSHMLIRRAYMPPNENNYSQGWKCLSRPDLGTPIKVSSMENITSVSDSSLKQSEYPDELVKEREVFITSKSNDLNNPGNNLSSYEPSFPSELAKKEFYDAQNELLSFDQEMRQQLNHTLKYFSRELRNIIISFSTAHLIYHQKSREVWQTSLNILNSIDDRNI